MAEYLVIIFGSIFINNFVVSRFLGICPFLGVSRQVETATGMAMAVTFVMGLASGITYMVQKILDALHIEFLQTITFILVIAVLVQFVEMVLKKSSPVLYRALGIYLPLITTNCAVLGVTILNIDSGYNFLQSVVNGIGGALGFGMLLILFAGIRENLNFAPIPRSLQGFPIALITAGLISIAFLGFTGFNLNALFSF